MMYFDSYLLSVPQEMDSDLMEVELCRGRKMMIHMEQRPQQIPKGTPELGLTISDVMIWSKGSGLCNPSLTIIGCRLPSERENDTGHGSFLKQRALPGEGFSSQFSTISITKSWRNILVLELGMWNDLDGSLQNIPSHIYW